MFREQGNVNGIEKNKIIGWDENRCRIDVHAEILSSKHQKHTVMCTGVRGILQSVAYVYNRVARSNQIVIKQLKANSAKVVNKAYSRDVLLYIYLTSCMKIAATKTQIKEQIVI